MARKAKNLEGKVEFPVSNFTNFSFKADLTPFFKVLIVVEFILCGLCVLGAALLVLLTYL